MGIEFAEYFILLKCAVSAFLASFFGFFQICFVSYSYSEAAYAISNVDSSGVELRSRHPKKDDAHDVRKNDFANGPLCCVTQPNLVRQIL
jgi:hypothetical protein